MDSPHDHDMTTRYTFDDVGIPYDFDDNDPSEEGESSSSTESARGKSSSSQSNSGSDHDQKEKELSLPSRTEKVRGRLDGRLRIPNREGNGACSSETRDDNWMLSKGIDSGGPFSYKVLAPTLHKFIMTDKCPRDMSLNVDKVLENLYKVRLRGRVDGRLFNPDLQPQWATSVRRPRSPGTYEFKIPSFHEHHKINRMLKDILPKVRHFRPLDTSDKKVEHETSENLKAGIPEPNHTPRSSSESSKATGTTVVSVNAYEDQRSAFKETKYFTDSESSGENSPGRGRNQNDPLKQGNDFVKKILPSGGKERQQFRGRLDGRLYTPEGVDVQVTFTCTTLNPTVSKSPHQEITFNDSLGLEHRLLPESVNIFQKKKKNVLMEPSRVDGRAFALPRNAKWDFNALDLNVSPRGRVDERVPHRIWRPCRIQELGEKVLPHSFERNAVVGNVNDRPPTDEFPSSFDPDFIPEPTTSVRSKPTDVHHVKTSATTNDTRPPSANSVKSSHENSNQSLSENEMDPGLTVIDHDHQPHAVRKGRKRKPSPTQIIYRV